MTMVGKLGILSYNDVSLVLDENKCTYIKKISSRMYFINQYEINIH